MKRRKPKTERKEETVQLRLTAEQKRQVLEKAKARGIGLGTWLLQLGLAAPERPVGSG
jgi:hypothetical protein